MNYKMVDVLKMDDMISVIVPVYNMEQYLYSSFKSLVKQTVFSEMEIIAVDDGSRDDSLNILRRFERKYSNIHVYHQSNKGASVARNYGFTKAKGRFITFFDADDYAEPGLYERLRELIVTKYADLSIVDYSMCFKDGSVKKHRRKIVQQWDSKREALISFFNDNLICTNPVDKMFRREVIEDISFPEGYAVGEDMFYVYKAIMNSDRIVLDSTHSLYRYIIRDNSAMTSEFSRKQLHAVELAKMIMEELPTTDQVFEYAKANYIHEVCKAMHLMYRGKKTKKYRNEWNYFRKVIREYPLFRAAKYMSKKRVISLMLMKCSPGLYTAVYKTMKIG